MSFRPDRPDDALLDYFDRRLAECGDTAQGAWWPNDEDRRTRFDVMLGVFERDADRPIALCDLGCGTGELFAHIQKRGLKNVSYVGVDRSRRALDYARAKFPDAAFLELDVNAPGADLDLIACDYLVADGLFTGKFSLSQDEMWSFLKSTIESVWPKIRRGLAFNVMSKAVDWERDDLFHLSMDEAARLLHRLAGRRVLMRADYGLYEYTAYAFKVDQTAQAGPARPVTATEGAVPVLRPRLPPVERLFPYLRRIDMSRIYTNHGPLSAELEARLACRWSLPPGAVACAASGTAALVGAILATAGRADDRRTLALTSAFTFVATAAAIEQCGYRPYLADVDLESWMLDPEQLAKRSDLAQFAVVVPVAPFGRPVPQTPWRAFQEKTGIPVVIDGAAAFDRVSAAPETFLGTIPVVFSLHATKAFGVGEGGCVAAADTELIARVVQALNFGFRTARDSEAPSINGKMSEYCAAVGLAELDGWEQKQAALEAVADRYRRMLAQVGLERRLIASPDVSLAYVLFRCGDEAEAERLQAQLRRRGVDTRLWYGKGAHRQTYFAGLPRDPLPATEAVAPCVIGLPVAEDLVEDQAARVITALAEEIARID